jgi:hypothetical protein
VAFLSITDKENPRKAAKVKAAADWCADKLQKIPAGISSEEKKASLLQN